MSTQALRRTAPYTPAGGSKPPDKPPGKSPPPPSITRKKIEIADAKNAVRTAQTATEDDLASDAQTWDWESHAVIKRRPPRAKENKTPESPENPRHKKLHGLLHGKLLLYGQTLPSQRMPNSHLPSINSCDRQTTLQKLSLVSWRSKIGPRMFNLTSQIQDRPLWLQMKN